MNITDDYEGFISKTDIIDDENANVNNILKYFLLSTPSIVLLLLSVISLITCTTPKRLLPKK